MQRENVYAYCRIQKSLLCFPEGGYQIEKKKT